MHVGHINVKILSTDEGLFPFPHCASVLLLNHVHEEIIQSAGFGGGPIKCIPKRNSQRPVVSPVPPANTIGLEGVKVMILGLSPPLESELHVIPGHVVVVCVMLPSPSYDMTAPSSVPGQPNALLSNKKRRRLMVTGHVPETTNHATVGYESPTSP